MSRKIFLVMGILAFGWVIISSISHVERDLAEITDDLYKNTYILVMPEDINRIMPSNNSGDHGPILLPPHDPQQPINILQLK
ncbi:hypothetical protein [Desulfitibacter alkalitolerans]|uniref:hypothetical protein n=1 Tax=Desulfitibacter alkalitolerans TaxID=264641 RepID=UPI0004870F39|nr:hypothetical protein [Desulfitibacter alkalitolerans]